MKEKGTLIAGLALVACIFTFLLPRPSVSTDLENGLSARLTENAIISQKVMQTHDQEEEVLSIYYKDRLLGIIHDMEAYEAFLDRIYEERYAEEFPDSKVGLGEDVHISKSLSFFEVEDKDEEIFAYLEQNHLFSILGYKFEFSNGSIAYVKDRDEFIRAREDFVTNFLESDGVDPQVTLELLNNGKVPTQYSNQNRLDVAYKYNDTAKIAHEFVPLNLILNSYEECMEWLSFGYEYEPKTYTVQEGDMIQGVAWMNGISPTNLVYVNADSIKSMSQPLQVGMELNVTPINSPLEIEVIKERVVVEPDYPEDTEYIYDDTLPEGKQYTEQEEIVGSYRVMYRESYVNGVLDEETTTEVSRLQLEYSQRKKVHIGTMVIPDVGSGVFRYPVNNATVTCDWGCYWGHTAVDFQNMYNKWGNVLAADRGRVADVGWSNIGGYYVVINHNNGFYSYYGHMASWPWVSVGDVVAKGEAIGPIGMTGVATGPHVHFEIRTAADYGYSIYPWPYFGW